MAVQSGPAAGGLAERAGLRGATCTAHAPLKGAYRRAKQHLRDDEVIAGRRQSVVGNATRKFAAVRGG